jgi:hypothetical protein
MELNNNNNLQNFDSQILNNQIVVEEQQTLSERRKGIAL